MDQPAYTKPPKGVCKRALEEVIPDLIQDQNYNDTTAEFLMNKITQAVALKFKELQYESYKFIFHIILTEARGQGLRAHVGCYWDNANDFELSMKFVNLIFKIYQKLIEMETNRGEKIGETYYTQESRIFPLRFVS